MGAGNKKKTLSLKEKSHPSWNCSAPARNLRKSDLGAVIFGCKHNTIGECYSELLFGLPAPHFAYVKNISPGLPLFLFNYSDRKLYGIFEAAGLGQMNIDPYGWTSDGSDYTPYPAQVRVQIRMNCHPLIEDQFKPVISGNYYEKRLFWFELDRAQTKNLISLFSLSPVDASSSLPQNTARQNTLLNYLPTSDRRQFLDHAGAPVSQSGCYSHSNHCDLDVKAKESREKELEQTKSTLSSTTTSNSQQPKKWSALFKSPMTSDTSKEAGDLKVQASGSNSLHSYQGNMEWDSLQVTPCPEDESQGFVAYPEDSAMGSYEEVQAGSESNWELGYHSDQQRTSFDALTIVDTSQESEHFKAVESNENLPCSAETNMGWGSSRGTSPLGGESRPSEASTDDIIKTSEGEVLCLETTCKQSYSFADNHENATVPTSVMDEEHSEDGYSSGALTVSEMKSSDINSVVAELVQEIKELKAFQLEQDQKIRSLEQELVESKVKIQRVDDLVTAGLKLRSPARASSPATTTQECSKPRISKTFERKKLKGTTKDIPLDKHLP